MKHNIIVFVLEAIMVSLGKIVLAADEKLTVGTRNLSWVSWSTFAIVAAMCVALAIVWFIIIPWLKKFLDGKNLENEEESTVSGLPEDLFAHYGEDKIEKLEERLNLLPLHGKKLNQIDERLKALESLTSAKKYLELENKLIHLGEELRLLNESFTKHMGFAPSVPVPSRSLPSDMNHDHAALVAVVNKWWAMTERKREQLLKYCTELNITAHFTQIPNIHALVQPSYNLRPPYELDDSKDEGGWLLCRVPNNNTAFILPADTDYFTDNTSGFILVDMFGTDITPNLKEGRGFIFECAIRACELEDLSGGKFKVRKRGILQRAGKETPLVEMPLTFEELIAFKSQGRPAKTVWDELNNLKKDMEQLYKSMKTLEKNLLPKPTPSAISESSIAVNTQQTTEAAIKKIMPRLQAMESKIASELNQLQEEMNKKTDILPEQLKITLEKELKEYISKNINIHSKSAQVSEHNIQIETAIPVESQKTATAPKTGGGISIPPDGWEEALRDAAQNLDPESGLLQRLVWLQKELESYASQHGLQANFVHMSKIQEGQFELHPAILENGQGMLSCQGCATKVREKESLLVQFFVQLGDPQNAISWLFLPMGIEFTSDDFPSGYQLLIEGEQRGKIATIIRPAVLEQIVGPKNTYRVKTKMQLELEKKTTK